MNRRFIRGEATIVDLAAALDELGVGPGDEFFVSDDAPAEAATLFPDRPLKRPSGHHLADHE